MTATEATRILTESTPKDCGIRNVGRTVDQCDDVILWTCEVFDPYLPEGEDLIGFACFGEHYPEVDITWA